MNILLSLGGSKLRCLPYVKRQFVILKHSGLEKSTSAISELIKVNSKSIKEVKTSSNLEKIAQNNIEGVLGKSIKSITKKLTEKASSETTNYRRKPIFSNRKIHNGLNQTISVFRDLESSYHFLKLQPQVSSNPEVSRIFWFKFATLTRDKLDLLEAWSQATTLPPSTEDTTSDWESSIQDQFVSRLCQALPEYSYDQLADITYNLSQLNNRMEHLSLLTSLVDTNLTRKMKEKLQSKNVTEADINQSLRIAFIWLRRGMEISGNHGDSSPTNISVSKLQGLHNTSLLEIIFSDHLELLSPPQLVFSLFLVGVHREFPGCRADLNPGQGFSLPSSLYDKLSSVLPLLTYREVGVVCHCLHQAHLYLETEHSAVRQAALDCLVNFPESHIVRDQFTVSGVAKFMKKRGSENNRHVLSVMKKYKPHLHSLNSYTKLRLLQFILPGKPSPEDSREFMTELCQSMIGQLDQMRLKDLEQFTFCLFFLNNKNLNDNISIHIAQAMMKCDWANVRSGRSFVFLITFLVRMGRFEVDSINQIIGTANKCKMKNLHTDSGLASAIDFLSQLNIPWVREAKTTYIIKFIQRNRFLCRNSLFHVLELDCIREMYNLEGCEQLNPQLRKVLTNFLHSLPEHRLNTNFTEDGKIISSNFNDDTRSFVQRDLSLILGGHDRVWCGHPFPHSTSPVLIFAQNQNGQPISIPPSFCCYTSDSTISRVPDTSFQWTAVVVPSKGMMDRWGNYFGPVDYKLEHLAMLGYRTKVVFWVDYMRALQERNNLKYLRQMLKLNLKNKS